MGHLPLSAEDLCACLELHPDQFIPDENSPDAWSHLTGQHIMPNDRSAMKLTLFQDEDVLSLTVTNAKLTIGFVTFAVEAERFSIVMAMPLNTEDVRHERIESSNLHDVLEQADEFVLNFTGKRVKGETAAGVRDSLSWVVHRFLRLQTIDDFPEEEEENEVDLVDFIDENH